jgi:hypothetical protein
VSIEEGFVRLLAERITMGDVGRLQPDGHAREEQDAQEHAPDPPLRWRGHAPLHLRIGHRSERQEDGDDRQTIAEILGGVEPEGGRYRGTGAERDRAAIAANEEHQRNEAEQQVAEVAAQDALIELIAAKPVADQRGGEREQEQIPERTADAECLEIEQDRRFLPGAGREGGRAQCDAWDLACECIGPSEPGGGREDRGTGHDRHEPGRAARAGFARGDQSGRHAQADGDVGEVQFHRHAEADADARERGGSPIEARA